jgi:phage/plasmid-like protein (TIGR03299 family)
VGHNLFQNRMAFVGQTPWHELGTQVSETVTAKEMCSAAGLDWEVRKKPAPGARELDAKSKAYDRYLVLRDPVKHEPAPVALGLVTGAYEPLQNAEAFAFFEPLIASGLASFHTAGALGNGERVWVLAKLKGQIVVGRDDEVDRYLLLSNTHDGSGAVSVRFTPIRVVCQNTLNIAMKKGSSVISIRHTRSLTHHLAKAQARELMLIIDKVFDDAARIFDAMARRNLSPKETEGLLSSLFPRTRRGKEPERWGRILAIVDDAEVTPPATKDTLWGVYNAIVRDEDYRASREASAESRLARVWFGSGSDLKLRALALSRDLIEEAAA